MSKPIHVNENYIHNCDSEKVQIKTKVKAISQMGFTSEEVIRIMDFYLFNAPVLKGNKTDDFGLKSLNDYGWRGSSAMSRLESKLLNASGISIFCFIKSDSIDETLKQMNLDDEICTQHPRAVFKQNSKAVIYEDGSTEIKQHETRMECLFRHFRNAIAHNPTYLFDNENIMFEDCDESGKISARILMPKNALLTWIEIVRSGNGNQ